MPINYVGYLQGYITTTTDQYAHRAPYTPDEIESFARQITEDPKRRLVYLGDDLSQSVGEIIQFEVRKKGDWSGLWAKVGVYEDRADIWQTSEHGLYTAVRLNVGKESGGTQVDSASQDQSSLAVDVDRGCGREVENVLLQGVGAAGSPKDSEALMTLDITVPLTSLPSLVYGLYGVWSKMRGESGGQLGLRIGVGDRRLDFDKNTVGEIITAAKTARHSRTADTPGA